MAVAARGHLLFPDEERKRDANRTRRVTASAAPGTKLVQAVPRARITGAARVSFARRVGGLLTCRFWSLADEIRALFRSRQMSPCPRAC